MEVESGSTMSGNVYFSGYGAAYASPSESSPVFRSTSSSNIFCTGYKSCVNNVFEFGENMYCMTDYACFNAILMNMMNVYMYGGNSGAYLVAYGIGNNIYCGGYQACYQSMMNNISNSVYGNGYQALYESLITNVESNLYGVGYETLKSSTITNVTNVYCIGSQSCESTTVSNFRSLTSNGHNSLKNAMLISGNRGKTVRIYLNGSIDDDSMIYIYCNSTDTCKIDCQLNDICLKVNFECAGNCMLNCDDLKGNNCPLHVPYTLWNVAKNGYISEAPSHLPTSMPSKAPSKIPSQTPSNAPSDHDKPTAIPTELPIEHTFDEYNTTQDMTRNDVTDDQETAEKSNSNNINDEIVLIIVIICATCGIISAIIAATVAYVGKLGAKHQEMVNNQNIE